MRRLLLLLPLAASLLAGPALAQGDPNDRLSLESLTAPQAGDGHVRSYHRHALYSPAAYHRRRYVRRHRFYRRHASSGHAYTAASNQSPYLPYFYRQH